MIIREIDAESVIAEMPVLEPGTDLDDSYDLFICANGFEDRSLNGPNLLASKVVRIATSCVLQYRTNVEDNDSLRVALWHALDAVSDRVVALDDDRTEAQFDAAITDLVPHDEASILFDVSGCSGLYILRVMRTLFGLAERCVKVSVHLLYTCALNYAPTPDEAEKLIEDAKTGEPVGGTTLGLDWDAEDFPHVIERAGQHLDLAAERVIVICGFNADRMRASLDLIDTAFNLDSPHSSVMFVAGLPPRDEDSWRLDAMIRINSAAEDGYTIEPTPTSTLHYEDTMRVLEREYAAIGARHRLTILPFGSKMQSVAVALFCEAHPDVRVQMLAPTRYRGVEYSQGVRDTYLLRFEELGEVSQKLRSIGLLRVEEEDDLRPKNSAVAIDVMRGGS